MVDTIGIFVTGPSSTGKTTLCRALEGNLTKEGFRVIHLAEVARTVMREQGFTRDHVATLGMQKAILDAQIAAEMDAFETLEKLDSSGDRSRTQRPSILLCDRCAVDPCVYATMELTPDTVKTLTGDPLFKLAIARYGAQSDEASDDIPSTRLFRTIVILTDGVEEWREDDGIRSLYDPWKVATVFRQMLTELGIRYHEVGENIKDIGERTRWVLQLAGLE